MNTEATCVTAKSARVIDFFVFSRYLAGGAVGVMDKLTAATHKAGTYDLVAAALPREVRALRMAKPFPSHAVVGPQRPPPDYGALVVGDTGERMIARPRAGLGDERGALDGKFPAA